LWPFPEEAENSIDAVHIPDCPVILRPLHVENDGVFTFTQFGEGLLRIDLKIQIKQIRILLD